MFFEQLFEKIRETFWKISSKLCKSALVQRSISLFSNPNPSMSTRANASVHDLGKWYAKFRTGKFHPGIALIICTNQFQLPKDDREGLIPVSKMALNKWYTKFRLEYSVREKQDYLFRCSVAPGIFPMQLPKKSCPIYFKILIKRKQPFTPFLIIPSGLV